MNKLILTISMSSLLAVVAEEASPDSSPNKQPNIVLIMLDDMGTARNLLFG